MKPRIMTLIVAFVVAVSSAVFVAPSASADGLSNPSGTLTVSCPGADAFIQVDWKAGDRVTVRWRIDDTGTATNISPVLRIQARAADNTAAPFIFPSGDAFFVLRGGNGHHEVGLESDWNPDSIPNINHLRVKVQNGTTEQGTFCYQERNIYNWSMIAHKNAMAKRGEPYILEGVGTPEHPGYDCSGLVYASYNPIANFPGWPVRRAVDMWNWAKNNQSPGKFYAKEVAYSDLKVGDLIFYKTTAEAVGHVSFWEGDGRVLDALEPGTNVGVHDEGGLRNVRVAAFRILGVATVANG
ncbi:NlpC/P60 family protein [Nonomuraea turkmeniaca]|uniref:NlpC/P60 family protein n=1 Tax=Nonomuraea turkmeniaca TaxID=103838 RepID=A0A5S4FBQ1_9ACTN|nr:NlpC/P60 family protein [Nonomuraea turkmeniaca]TMR15072.1 NlpC/P60 family protein [Nonomuraea turkmeniaca]